MPRTVNPEAAARFAATLPVLDADEITVERTREPRRPQRPPVVADWADEILDMIEAGQTSFFRGFAA